MKKMALVLSVLSIFYLLCSCAPLNKDGDAQEEDEVEFVTDASNLNIENETGWQIAQYEYRTFLNDLYQFPVSFSYGGHHYSGFGSQFEEVSRNVIDEGVKERTEIVLRHEDGFEVTIDAAFYLTYGAYEWTLYFTNTSSQPTKTFKDVNAADIGFLGTNPVLKGLLGDQFSQYYPYEHNLIQTDVSLVTTTGRACEEYMPYFNLETDSGGALIALGWPGNWEAHFKYEEKQTRLIARQKGLESYLDPGETFRTPLMAFVRYGERNEALATNVWRDWFIDCNMPRVNGEVIQPVYAIGTNSWTDELTQATEDIILDAVKTFVHNGIGFDYIWLDAGWYLNSDNSQIGSWMSTGTWEVDTKRFPTSLKAISDYAHSRNGKTLLWFEPESVRVSNLDDFVNNYGFSKSWLMPNSMWGNNTYLADMGNPDYRNWLIERVKKVMEKGEIDLYRQDFNVRPTESWIANDVPGKYGLTENSFCMGYLDYYDCLLKWNPQMFIDSCASGGNRNDLETMRRAVVFHRSDRGYGDPDLKQSMYMEFSKWIPFSGTVLSAFEGNRNVDAYNIRSTYGGQVMNIYYPYALTETDWDIMYQCQKEWREVSQYLYEDFYPLTPFSRNTTDWRGWQYITEDGREGYFQMFNPEHSESEIYTVRLHGLNENSVYKIKDFDNQNNFECTGKQLMDGIQVRLKNRSVLTAMISEVG